MTAEEQRQFCERLDSLCAIVSDSALLAEHASLVLEDEWGGADLIITTDPHRNRWETDTFVVVKDIKPILWMMDELRELYNELGTSISKYTFYPRLGVALNEALAKGDRDTASLLTAMIEAARTWASIYVTRSEPRNPEATMGKTRKGTPPPFDRNISGEFIRLLNEAYARGGWWRKAVGNSRLFLAIRDEYINIYYCGMSVLRISKNSNQLKAFSHVKFLVDPDGSPYFEFNKDGFGIQPSTPIIFDLNSGMNRVINNAAQFASEEKRGVHNIILSSNTVLDIEICVPGKRENRMDIAAIEQSNGGHKLVFYEAKAFNNQELRASGNKLPPVVEQISRYRNMLNDRQDEILAAYQTQIENLVALEGLPAARKQHLRDVGPLKLDTTPRLLVFGFDRAQQKWWKEQSSSYKMLVRELGKDMILARGNAGGFALPH